LSISKPSIAAGFIKDLAKIDFDNISPKPMTRWRLEKSLYIRSVHWTSTVDGNMKIRLDLYLNL
jgi:hypothetical protein